MAELKIIVQLTVQSDIIFVEHDLFILFLPHPSISDLPSSPARLNKTEEELVELKIAMETERQRRGGPKDTLTESDGNVCVYFRIHPIVLCARTNEQ